MAYRIHDLAGDGVDAYFNTAAEAEAAVAAAARGATAPEPTAKKPAEKPRKEED